MNRRDTVLALFGLGVAATPLIASAQSGKIWRIGYFGPPTDVAPHLIKAFRDGPRELGYVEGRNIAVESAGPRIGA